MSSYSKNKILLGIFEEFPSTVSSGGSRLLSGAGSQALTTRSGKPLFNNLSGQGGMANALGLGHASQSLHVFFREAQGNLRGSGRSDNDIEFVEFLGECFYTMAAPEFMFFSVILKTG